MSVAAVSSASLYRIMTKQLTSVRDQLADLSTQLSSGKKHSDLAEYDATDAKNTLNLKSTIALREAYLNNINTVSTRLTSYDSTLTDMESLASLAKTLAAGNQTYSADTASSIAATADSYLKSIEVDLNQQLNGRYLYAGSRYDTKPVSDLTSLGTPSATIYSDNLTLPDYDTGYAGVGSTDATAYALDSATIADGYSVSYGVSSDNPAFQKLIAGMRFLKAAGQSTDQATYTTNITQATSLLTSALVDMQAVHTAVANDINLMTTEKKNQNTAITNLANQLSDITNVDTTQVSVEITAMQTTLEASYTVTGNLGKMSLANYL